MVEEYGRLEFFGDIQTPATKASSSDIYPAGAWDLGHHRKWSEYRPD